MAAIVLRTPLDTRGHDFTADGVKIAQFGAERRQFLPIAQMSRLLRDVVIAVEDARFREHSGIDARGMARAALAMLSGGRRQGASTITQQVARLLPPATLQRRAQAAGDSHCAGNRKAAPPAANPTPVPVEQLTR
jgi:membrane carboxypeptidase/penicillin-binding protein